MKQFRFLEWKVYKDSQEVFSFILNLVNKLPQQHRYGLGDQLLRSASSISLNIAEGSGKQSEKELNRFIETALGSLYETIANLDTLRLNKLINEGDFNLAKDKLAEISKQLGGFKKKLDL